MRRVLLALACLAAFAPIGVAQTFDKAAFRQAIGMPAIATHFGVNYKASERDGKGATYDPKAKIAEFEKKLTGRPEDAEVYLDERAVYLECLKDEKAAKALLEKAQAVLHPIRETTDASQGYFVVLYATVVETLADNPWKDCEQWGKRAVSVAPQDWRTWAYLAHARHQQIPSILCGGDDKLLDKGHRTQQIIGMLVGQRCQPEHIEAAEKALDEALKYHDKARELAPNDPKRQVQRYGFRLAETMMRNAFAASRRQKPPFPMAQLERVMLDELQAAAKLHPDHILWQSQLAHQLTVVGWQEAQEKNQGKPAKTFRAARPEDQQAIHEALANIEKLAEAGKGETSIYCYSVLAALNYSLGEHAVVEKTARKILAIDAKNQSAWEQLLQSLVLQERNADYLKEAQNLAQTLPSPRNCFLLAKALAANQRFDLAEQACVTGFKQNRTRPDIHCTLGLAALTMRNGDDAANLKTAGDLLTIAKDNCTPEQGALAYTELEYLSAVHDALAGNVIIGRLKLQRLQEDAPDNPRYEKLLTALGR